MTIDKEPEKTVTDLEKVVESQSKSIRAAIDLAVQFGGVDEDLHNVWVIDQMVRLLAGKDYDRIVGEACAGEDGPQTYEWHTGIAP